ELGVDRGGRNPNRAAVGEANCGQLAKTDGAVDGRHVDVKREGVTVGRETFAAFVDRFLDTYLPTKGLKPSTMIEYTNTLRGHAVPILGAHTLTELEQRPELL